MANLMDYLDWRGDLTLEQSPFNEVDNLILSELSFVDFQEIVPSPGSGKSVELRYAAESFFSRFQEGEKIDMGVLVPDEIPNMLRRMADSRRFGEMRLNCFVDWLDVGKGEQFAALTIETGDGRLYLSFRGTDDTLAGWREDFELACMPEVPAQKKALQYVEEVARQFPRKSSGWGDILKEEIWQCTPGCSVRQPCRGALPPSGPMMALASTRTCWTCLSTAVLRSASILLYPSPLWWECCWSTKRITRWWTAISWVFCSMMAFPGR